MAIVTYSSKKMFGGGTVTAYPTATCVGNALAGAAGADADGAYTEIIAASTITTRFRVVGITLDTPVGAMTGRVSISRGAAGSEVDVLHYKFEIATDAGGFLSIDTTGHGGIIPANSRIAACLATTAGGAQTINCSVLCEPC